MTEGLLPCPFCGSDVLFTTSGTCDREGYPVCMSCNDCGCCGPSAYVPSPSLHPSVADEWNTRYIHGHKVTFKYQAANLVFQTSQWLVIDDGYLYGPCERWEDVAELIRMEWKHDRHLVG